MDVGTCLGLDWAVSRSNEMFTPIVTKNMIWDQGCFLLAFLVVRAVWQCPRTSFFLLPINKCAGLKVSQQEKWTPHLEGDFRSVLQHNRTTKNSVVQAKLV